MVMSRPTNAIIEVNASTSQWSSVRAEVEIDPQLAQAASRRSRLETAIKRLTVQISHLTRRNKFYVVGTLTCVSGGILSLMFFATPLFLFGGSLMGTALDVRRRRANASARWLGQQRRALEGCANDPARWLGQPRCVVEGCVAAHACELRQATD
jgi:hypothetical protein